jgi:UDP-3-O-[3-hydroxymyristoyl] glucosamine N-acyltransferase
MAIDASAQVHASAVIEEGAVIGPDCRIGPFTVVGAEAVLHRGVELKSHVVVTGATEIGEDSVVFPFSVIGEIPQDLKFKGEKSRLVIGKRNRIRESVTMNCGTEGGGGITRIGDDGLFMAGCHIAHDAQVGDRVIVVNSAAVAGHCVIEDDVIIGGLCGIHQWVRIGQGAIIGALSKLTLVCSKAMRDLRSPEIDAWFAGGPLRTASEHQREAPAAVQQPARAPDAGMATPRTQEQRDWWGDGAPAPSAPTGTVTYPPTGRPAEPAQQGGVVPPLASAAGRPAMAQAQGPDDYDDFPRIVRDRLRG